VLTQKLLKQDYVAPQLKSVVQRMYGRHHERVYSYTLFISQMAMDFSP
jgi:cytochrome c2